MSGIHGSIPATIVGCTKAVCPSVDAGGSVWALVKSKADGRDNTVEVVGVYTREGDANWEKAKRGAQNPALFLTTVRTTLYRPHTHEFDETDK